MELAIFRPHDQYWFSKDEIAPLKIRTAKYSWIIDAAIAEGHTVHIVPFTPTSFRIPELKFFFIDSLRLLRWFYSQRSYYPPSQFKLSLATALPKNTQCVLFAYGNLTHFLIDAVFRQRSSYILEFLNRQGLKYCLHLTHFAYNLRFLASQLDSLDVFKYFAESYLPQSSPYCAKFLSFEAPFITLPFLPSNRFACRVPLLNRQPNILSTGTIAIPPSDSDYSSFYGFTSFQPIREAILSFSKEQNSGPIHCISAFLDPNQLSMNGTPLDYLIKRLFSLFSNPRHHTASASSTSEDIVELYNRFVFAVVGEEACGLPGIGFFEAMACGCVCFATKTPTYTSLGLEPDKHFIAYDGSLHDLLSRHQTIKQDAEYLQFIQTNSLSWVSSLTPSLLFRHLVR